MTRPLHTRLAAQHHAARLLEHAADAEFARLTRYVDSYRVHPRVPPRWLLERTERWWKMALTAEHARDRLHRLLACLDALSEAALAEQLAELHGTPLHPSSSWGVPGSRRGTSAPAPSSALSNASPEGSPLAPPASPEWAPVGPTTSRLSSRDGDDGMQLGGGNRARTPDGYTGTPQTHDEPAAGQATVVEAADSPGRAGPQEAARAAAPPLLGHGSGDCDICGFLATHVRDRKLLEVA